MMKRGNDAQRARLSYDERGELAYFERLAQTFDQRQIERLRTATPGDEQTPNLISIVGMPRSGTTLLEQILASHPQVHGAGELTALHDAIRTVSENRHLPPYPQSVPLLDRDALSDIASRYLSAARSGLGAKTHLVDKMPSNFHHLGLIGAVLPRARIIHCVRDPLDTCFSRYAKLFLDRNAYSYDLGELGRYHRAYERLMAHWRETLPRGAVLEVRYEDVVADLGTQGRRMLDFCGLSWSDRCLAFNQTQRAVRTPSALQVRQPLYGGAIGRAKPYEAFLGSLKTALDGG